MILKIDLVWEEGGNSKTESLFESYGLRLSWLKLMTNTLDHLSSLVWPKVFMRLNKH